MWLFGPSAVPARADDIHLTASGGLGGWYRPGGWNPISVTVQNTSDDAVTGQLQVKSWGQNIFNSSEKPVCLYARPLSIPANSSQSIAVYPRGVDPFRDRLNLSFAEGQERGDGRVLAQLDNDPTNSNPTNSNLTLTAMPLGDNDLLLAGFSGSPGAFQSLHAQTAGVIGQVGSNADHGTTQIASLVAADLPDRAVGYSAVTAFLIRDDAPVDAMTETQADALKGWVASGGRLMVFCTGTDPNVFAASFYQDLLPATVGPVGTDGKLSLFPRAVAGIQIVQRSPLIITAPYGNGWVIVTNFDPWSASVSPNSLAITSLWRNLLAEHTTYPFLARMTENDEKSSLYYWASIQPDISHTVKPSDATQSYGTEIIGIYLLSYLIILVPASYFLIRKTGRKQLVWVIIPLGTLLFSGATFGIGYAANGRTVIVNRAAVIETNSGQRTAGVYAALGLYSPSRASFDLNVTGENSMVALPVDDNQIPKNSLIKFVQKPFVTNILDVPVNMGETRTLEMRSTIDLGGPISFNSGQSAGVAGMITNHSNFDLTDCQVYYRGQWQPVGPLKQGGSFSVASPRRAAHPASEFELPLISDISPNDKLRAPSRSMRIELDEYLSSLGQQDTTLSDDALFFGWAYNPAIDSPPVQVDGHSVPENDVCLVIVHLRSSGK